MFNNQPFKRKKITDLWYLQCSPISMVQMLPLWRFLTPNVMSLHVELGKRA